MIAMFAPSRLPPCVIIVDTDDRCLSTATGPHADPCVEAIGAPFALKRVRATPVPPPNFCTRATCRAVSMMPSILSSRGSTKQPLNVPAPLPAFISVGELG